MKKVTLLTAFILAFAAATFAATSQQQMQLEVVDVANNQMDLTFIYFAQSTSTTYHFPEDQQKTIDTAQDIPQLYSFSSDNVACYSNGYGNFSTTTIIPLGLNVALDTTYVFSLAGIENFDPSTLILLEDRQTGNFTNLRGGTYTMHVYQAGAVNNRFYLHITFPPAVTTIASGCNNNSGTVAVALDSSAQWTSCILFDSAGQVVKSYNNVTGNVTFGGLAEGAYNVVFLYNGYLSSRPAQVDGHHIDVNINASTLQTAVGEAIDFFSTALNTTNYNWQFGDSTVEDGIANPSYAYANAGNYMVTLTASNNFGCFVTATIDVSVSTTTTISNINLTPITMVNDNNNLKIGISNVANNNYNYELYNTAGQMLRTGPVSSPDFEVNLSGLSAGVYLASVKWNAGTYTKKIVVSQ
jgi:hypothetical protein